MNKVLQNHFTKLRLSGVQEIFEETLEQSIADDLGYEDFLIALLEYESNLRNNKMTTRLLRQSNIPIEKSFDSFDLKRLPMKTRNKIKSLEDGSFLDRKENILAFGKPGSGKTHLLCAIALNQIYKGRKIYFNTCSNLLQHLLVAKKELRLPEYLKKLSKFDAIVIDDIGYVQQSREEMEVLFTLLADRYERGSILLTSNLPFSKWNQIFKDDMTTAAAIDRLVHHSIILEINVPSYRTEEAKKNLSKG